MWDTNKDGKITIDEYTSAIQKLTKTREDDIVEFLFGIFDADNSGELTHGELQAALNASLEESGMDFDADQVRTIHKPRGQKVWVF